jgi:hypothetical protein
LPSKSLEERVAKLTPMLSGASRALVMRAAGEPDAPATVFGALAAYLKHRWGLEPLLDDASRHRTARDKWRRMAALRILFRLNHPDVVTLLASAAENDNVDIASTALSLLGQSDDPAAIDVMIAALRSGRHPASRIAVHLEHSPQQYADRLRPLLRDNDPTVRLWSATLLGRYTDVDQLELELAPLADDADPRVRKAAIVARARLAIESPQPPRCA